MKKWCEKLAYYFYKKGYIKNEDINALRFSFELYITQIITFLTMFIIGLCLNRCIETIIYMVFFSILRKKINGYHAQTFLRCYILSIVSYVVVLFLSLCSVRFYLLNIFFMIYIIWYFKKSHDIVIHCINIGYILLILVLYFYQFFIYLNLISLIYYTVMLMNVLGEKEHESSNH